MGYRGNVEEQEKARALRAQNRTLADIAQILGVSKSSVSLWVRDARSHRHSDCAARTGARIPRTKQSSVRSTS